MNKAVRRWVEPRGLFDGQMIRRNWHEAGFVLGLMVIGVSLAMLGIRSEGNAAPHRFVLGVPPPTNHEAEAQSFTIGYWAGIIKSNEIDSNEYINWPDHMAQLLREGSEAEFKREIGELTTKTKEGNRGKGSPKKRDI